MKCSDLKPGDVIVCCGLPSLVIGVDFFQTFSSDIVVIKYVIVTYFAERVITNCYTVDSSVFMIA